MKFETILNIVGYALYTSADDEDDQPVNVLNILPVVIHDVRNFKEYTKKEMFKLFMKFLYNAVIFLIIMWSFIFSLMTSISRKEFDYVSEYIFQLIFSIQYIVGIWYFNENHFFDKLKKFENIKYQFSHMAPFAIIIALVVAIFITSITIFNVGMSQNTVLYIFNENKSGGLMFILFVQTFYSYASFLLNTVGFVLIMMHHRKEIDIYTDKIGSFMTTSGSLSSKVRIITMEILNMNIDFGESVDKLNWFFSTFSILGILHIVFITRFLGNDNKLSPVNILNLVLFGLVEYTYISFAQKLRKSVSKINNDVQKSVHTNNYLKRATSEKKIHNITTISRNILYELSLDTSIHISEVRENIAWLLLKDILQMEWATFELLGIQITDTSLIQKLFAGISAVLIAKNVVNISSI